MRRSLSSWVKSLFPTAPTRPIRKPRSLTLEQLETRDCPTVLPPPGPGFLPQANPDHFTFTADTPIRISVADLLANDTAAPGVPLSVELLDSPADGQLNLIDVGLWEYMPGTGFTGSDVFSYRLFDGTDTSLPALVTFEQQPATPATPTVIDVTETWLTGFEDETLGSVTVAVFETAEADVLDWTASIDWGDGTTTTGQIVADGDGRYRVVGDHTYDEWGLYLVQVTLTDTAEATHDLFNLASIQFRNYTYTFTDPIGNSTQFVFAEGWRLTQEIDPLGNSTFYSYTTDGLLASRTDRLGRAITFDYGTDGVLVGQTWLAADLTTVADTLSFSYTSDGLLQSASNGVGAYTFSWYDGQLLGATNPFGVTLTFGYDADGRRTSVADSFGGLITSTYTDGLLASRTLTAGALNLRVDLGYDADGVPTQISRFTGPLQELVSQTEYAFAQGLLASITHRGAGGVILDQFLYQFDEDGFLSQITSDFAGETDYSYDSDGQLTGESSLLVSSTFSYDANGNRVGSGYVVGSGNRLLADGTWSYSYDAEGNLVGKTHLVTGDSWSYSYDHRNQMTLAEKRDASGTVVLLAVYKYDVFGNRIEKAVDWDGDGPNAAVVTRYVLDGWNNMKPTPIGNEHFDVIAELDGSNQLLARYLHGDAFDQTFARISYGEPGASAPGFSPEVHWLLTDHLNSVRLVLDESGAVLDQIAYDAFGNIVAQLNPLLVNPILFASREFDFETGLYYNRARYLDPTTGRWTTQDPLGFAAGDANLYRYVGNMATMATDPSGLIIRQVGSFLWGVGKGIVEIPAMFIDTGHALGALAYMEITGRPYIPTYLSMTANAADQASVQGGREAVGEMLGNAYIDLFTFGVRPLYHALQAADNGDWEPLGQATGMLIFGWAAGGGGFRPHRLTLPPSPRPVLAFAGVEGAVAAPAAIAIPVPYGLPIPIILHMTVPEPPNGTTPTHDGGNVPATQGQSTRVFTTTEGPVDLGRPGTGATNAQTGLPTATGAGGTFVTPTDITNPAVLELHLQRSVPPGTNPRYVVEIEVPTQSLRPDPTGDVRPYHGWIAPNTPGVRVVRMWEIRWVLDPRGFEVPTLVEVAVGGP